MCTLHTVRNTLEENRSLKRFLHAYEERGIPETITCGCFYGNMPSIQRNTGLGQLICTMLKREGESGTTTKAGEGGGEKDNRHGRSNIFHTLDGRVSPRIG